MTTSLTKPRVTVRQQRDACVIAPIDRPSDLHAKFLQVVNERNPGMRLPTGERHGPRFNQPFAHGPALFNVTAIESATGRGVSQLGGMQVPHAQLSVTLARLRALGFEVLQ